VFQVISATCEISQQRERERERAREKEREREKQENAVDATGLLALIVNGCLIQLHDRLCGLVARVLGYRSGGPGSIPSTTRKEK
jgi:hypothetical protein